MSKPKLEDADVLIHAEGFATVWMFEPVSEAAKQFFAEQVLAEDWQTFKGSLCVDHRPARDLADHLHHEGFTLLNPRYGFYTGGR